MSLRVLLLADTHLGLDWARRPRVQRRRRGDDFLANYLLALQPALNGEVDLVVHGGDLLFRSKVPPALVELAVAPLREVCDAGVPVVLLPGNHERSHIPHGLLARHQGLHVIDRPRTVPLELAGRKIAVAGFPCQRDDVRRQFTNLLEATGWRNERADIRLLCLHQCVEGATVGPGNFTFRNGADVVRAADLPEGLAAVLSGHIHRHQVLEHDLKGRPLAAPVLYPGSIERTSFAEQHEPKGYLVLEFVGSEGGGLLQDWRFVELPARPMVTRSISAAQLESLSETELQRKLAELPVEAVVQLRVDARPDAPGARLLSSSLLRELAPATMNVSVHWKRRRSGV